MNSLKKTEGIPLLNFEGGPGVPLLNFEGGPGSRIPGSRGPGSLGPGPTFTPCHFKKIFYHVTLENIFKILNNSVYFQNIVVRNEPKNII